MTSPPDRALSRPLLVILVLGVIACWVGTTNHEVWTADEPRVAAIGAEMATQDSWAVPRLGGEPFLEKPPLYWWVQATVFRLAGTTSSGLARVPSALFGIVTLLLTFALGRRFLSAQRSMMGCLVLLTMASFLRRTHWVIVDMALLFAVTGALCCFVYAERRPPGRRGGLLFGMYGFLALAFFSKGIVGPGIPSLGMLAYLLWTRRTRAFLGWHVALGAAGIGALIGLWLWRVHADVGAEGLRTFLVYNNFGRFFADTAGYDGGHERPFYYYLTQGLAELLPWTPVLLVALLSLRRNWSVVSDSDKDATRFALATTVPVVVALSFASTKRGLYLLPLLPAVSVLLGAWLTAGLEKKPWERKFERAWQWLYVGLGALAALAVVLLGSLPEIRFSPDYLPHALLGVVVVSGVYVAARPRSSAISYGAWFQASAVMLAGLCAAFVTAAPRVDQVKSLAPVGEMLKEHVPAGAPIYAFDPSETMRGVISFYDGRHSRNLLELSELRELSESLRTAYVLVEDKSNKGTYHDIVDAKIKHRKLDERSIGDSRFYRLLVVGEDG